MSYTRPAGLVEIESGVDASGRLTALRFTNYNSGAAGLTPPYDSACPDSPTCSRWMCRRSIGATCRQRAPASR